jgi:hypothetical protein
MWNWILCVARKVDTAHAIHIPAVMIHTILKGVQEIETKAVN